MTIGQTSKGERRLIAYTTAQKLEAVIINHYNITKRQIFKSAEVEYLLNGKKDADLEELRKKHLDYYTDKYIIEPGERKRAKVCNTI